jgi:hypothetical protein
MNYIEDNSVIKSYFNGSRRLSNIFWATAVSLGGTGFFFNRPIKLFSHKFIIFFGL